MYANIIVFIVRWNTESDDVTNLRSQTETFVLYFFIYESTFFS